MTGSYIKFNEEIFETVALLMSCCDMKAVSILKNLSSWKILFSACHERVKAANETLDHIKYLIVIDHLLSNYYL